MVTKTNEKESKLITQLWDDEKLKVDKDKQMNYIGMANILLSDFKNNMNKTSIEMNDLEPNIGIDEWRDFLNYPVVRRYINGFREERITNRADEGLMSGDKGAIGIKKAIQNSGSGVNNSNIVLIRVPEKKDFEEV